MSSLGKSKKTWSEFFFVPHSSKNAMKVSFSLHTETSGISLVWFLYDLKQACIAFFEALQSSVKKYSDPAEAATRCALQKILHVFKEKHLCRSLFFVKFIKKRWGTGVFLRNLRNRLLSNLLLLVKISYGSL